MSQIDVVRKQVLVILEELVMQVHGIALDKGTSLGETLAHLGAGEASRPIIPGGTSVAAQVEHICFYMDVLLDYMQGQAVEGIDWQRSWNVRQLSPTEWEALRERLQSTYDRVRSQLESPAGWETEEQINGALGIVAHTAYHLGAIRQIARTVKSQ